MPTTSFLTITLEADKRRKSFSVDSCSGKIDFLRCVDQEELRKVESERSLSQFLRRPLKPSTIPDALGWDGKVYQIP